MKIKSARFVTSAPNLAACPDWDLREFALIGRSNVGKSSLLNALAGKKGLAKVSAVPGKTRMLNFFLMNDTWSLVDLPGYGFAKVSGQERYDFNEAVAEYLSRRTQLAGVFLLIDSRHEPQKLDLEFIRWLDSCRVPFSLVFTKVDKQSPTGTQCRIRSFQEHITEHQTSLKRILTSSIKESTGRLEILRFIEETLQGP